MRLNASTIIDIASALKPNRLSRMQRMGIDIKDVLETRGQTQPARSTVI